MLSAVSIKGHANAYVRSNWKTVQLIAKEVHTNNTFYEILVDNKKEWIEAKNIKDIVLPPSISTGPAHSLRSFAASSSSFSKYRPAREYTR
jgi:hypothetical protein